MWSLFFTYLLDHGIWFFVFFSPNFREALCYTVKKKSCFLSDEDMKT